MDKKQSGFSLLSILILVAIFGWLVVKFYPTQKTKPLPAPSVVAVKKDSTKPTADLEKYLTVQAALLGATDNISLYFNDLSSGEKVAIDPVRSWIPASTIKSFVVLEAFKQRRLGLINFDSLITIKAQNVVPTELETDDYPRLREGTIASVKQLVEAMVVQSDNTAYNSLLDLLDRRSINSSLRELGITETVVGEKLNLDDSQFQKDLIVPGRQPNTTTAKDLATLFERLYSHQLPDSEEMLGIFKKQKINNMIPAFLPSNVTVAHKTGDWAPIYHDGGVVYKAEQPFVLTVFTNDNDPQVIAKLAQVAYYQTADVVGEKLQIPQPQTSRQVVIALAHPEPQTVLGVSNEESFPQVTAADLGITAADLTKVAPAANLLPSAWINPGSLLYPVKRYIESLHLKFAQTTPLKVQVLLEHAATRLAEARSLVTNNQIDQVGSLLDESADDLKEATNLAQADQSKEAELVQIKQLSDLHFATLAKVFPKVKDKQKATLIDNVYHFYQRNQIEVLPVVKKSIIANPLQQQPVIGTVKEVVDGKLVLETADGRDKEVLVAKTTAVREFQKDEQNSKKQFKVGQRVAIVGQTSKEGKLVPIFILDNLPNDLPEKHQGKVTKIDTGKNRLEIENNQGKKEQVIISPTSVVKAKDTNVSIEGIKAGSSVTVYGTTGSTTPSTTTTTLSTVQATTVTVTQNSSGSNETTSKKDDKKSDSKDKK